MGIKIVLFISLLNCLLSYNLFEAASVNKSNLIIDMMVNDINTCANNSIVIQSKYVKQACSLSFPDKPSDIKNETFDQYLCAALYDQSVKTCLKTPEKKDLFGNQTIFDEEINKILKNETKFVEICYGWKPLAPEYNKTKPFVDKLNLLLKSQTKCINSCGIYKSGNFDSVNSLCAILYYTNQKLTVIQNNESNKKASGLKPSEVENHKTTTVPKLGDTGAAVVAAVAAAPKSQPSSESQATTGDHPDAKKLPPLTKKPGSSDTPDSGATTTKNDGNKIDSNNQGDKTLLHNNEANVDNSPTTDKKEDNNGNVGMDRPDTFDQTMMNEDNMMQHPEDDMHAEDERDQLQIDDDDDKLDDQDSLVKSEDKKDTVPILSNMQKEDDSHFFGYFTILGAIGIGGCLAYHHKQKILAILLEGRRSRGGRGRRRPSTANYRKLDCTLEEAVTSQCNTNVTHVIY